MTLRLLITTVPLALLAVGMLYAAGSQQSPSSDFTSAPASKDDGPSEAERRELLPLLDSLELKKLILQIGWQNVYLRTLTKSSAKRPNANAPRLVTPAQATKELLEAASSKRESLGLVKKGDIAETQLFKKCAPAIAETVRTFDVFSSNKFAEVLYIKTGSPFGCCEYATFGKLDGKTAAVVIVGLGDTLNSAKLEEEERIRMIAFDYLLPSLKSFESLTTAGCVDLVGVSVTYGVRNFVTDKEYEMSTEMLCLLWTRDDYKKLREGAITREEFITHSVAFFGKEWGDVLRVRIR